MDDEQNERLQHRDERVFLFLFFIMSTGALHNWRSAAGFPCDARGTLPKLFSSSILSFYFLCFLYTRNRVFSNSNT